MRNSLMYDKDWLTVRYVDEKLTLRQIGLLAGGVTVSTVRKALVRFGIPRRTLSEAAKGRAPRKRGPMSEEQKQKLSEAKKGKPSTAVWTPEMREALAEKRRGENNPAYKDGKSPRQYQRVPIRSIGILGDSLAVAEYRLVTTPPGTVGAYSNRQMLEHRYVMQVHLGRPLLETETVHHINGNTFDNRIENLQLRQGKHGKGVNFVCGDCGSTNIVSDELAWLA